MDLDKNNTASIFSRPCTFSWQPPFLCKYIKRLEDFEFFTGIKTKLLQKINQHLINADKVMADRPYFCTEIKINGGHLKDVENTHFERLWWKYDCDTLE